MVEVKETENGNFINYNSKSIGLSCKMEYCSQENMIPTPL